MYIYIYIYIINLHRLSCKVTVIPARFLQNFNFLDRYLKNTQISNSMKIRPVVVELFHADGKTDTTELTVASRNSAIAPKHQSVKDHLR